MIIKARYDLRPLTRGGDYRQPLRFLQPDKSPWDMTGCTVEAECMESASRDSVKLFDFVVDDSELSTGTAYLTVSRAVSTLIPVTGNAYWRLRVLNTDDILYYYISGRLPIED